MKTNIKANIVRYQRLAIATLVLAVLLAPSLLFAQNIEIKNPFKVDTVQGLITLVLNDILLPIGAVICALMVMYAGFMYVTARGNPAKISKAHDALLYACIGAVILLGAWTISQAISGTVDKLKTG